MAVNVYEGLFILDSGRYARDAKNIANQVDEMITKLGGEILVSRLWEERRLAYPINGQRKGTYWLAYFRLDSLQVATLYRECELNEIIHRALILKVDSRIVEPLVEHAKTGTVVRTETANVNDDDDDTDDEGIEAEAEASSSK